MSAGRPTKYNKDMLLLAQEYIDSCKDYIVKDGVSRVKLPKAEGLALHLKVNRSTLYEWADKHEDFSDILDKINAIQAERVINEALAGNYNSNIAKLLLGKHGYKDMKDTDITTGGDKINGPILVLPMEELEYEEEDTGENV